jgi:hypothetical protein
MEASLTEIVLVVAVVLGLYRLLRPVQEWLEDLIVRLLDPKQRAFIAAEVIDEVNRKKKHKE